MLQALRESNCHLTGCCLMSADLTARSVTGTARVRGSARPSHSSVTDQLKRQLMVKSRQRFIQCGDFVKRNKEVQ